MTKRHAARASGPSHFRPQKPKIAAAQSQPLPQALVIGVTHKDVAAPEALSRISAELAHMRLQAAAPLLRMTVQELNNKRFPQAVAKAKSAVELDRGNGIAWYLLAISYEKTSEFTGALNAYEQALALMPDYEPLPLDLGRLASALKMPEMAEKFLAYHLVRHPDSYEAANDMASALREQSRFADAVEAIRPYLYAHPEQAILWNTLGSILFEQGEMEQSVTFYAEAIRLDPAFDAAYYNRANSRVALGDIAGALVDCERALKGGGNGEAQAAMMRFAYSNMLLVAGRIGEGWDAYCIREDRNYADFTHYVFEGPEWTPQSDLSGQRLFVIGEQGLGDEVMFANTLPDIVDALGPDGELLLALEPRLVTLFQRSFPDAKVVRHGTWKVEHMKVRGAPHVAAAEYDLWTRIGSPLRRFRRTAENFPQRPEGYLKPDPERVAHWRRTLDELAPGPKVGLIWKSLVMNAVRTKFFSPFEQWRSVLATPGVTFINLQYGECAEELARAKSEFGVEILQPPGIDLKEDLDDLAALTRALDLVVGPATATTNLAAAVGAPTWMISTPDAWPRLGTDHYPWYPQARVFAATHAYDWKLVMANVAEALTRGFPAA